MSRFYLTLSGSGAGMAVSSLWHAALGANLNDCLLIAVAGAVVAAAGFIGLGMVQPEVWP